jgi:plasmid stabilization system protein ParE
MRRLRYLDSARADLLHILDYVGRESGSAAAAVKFTGVIRAKCRQLAELPGMLGRARPELHPDLRSFALGNYVIFFRYADDRFEVVNILERHRDIDEYFNADLPR